MLPLGDWVLEQALHQVRRWRQSPPRDDDLGQPLRPPDRRSRSSPRRLSGRRCARAAPTRACCGSRSPRTASSAIRQPTMPAARLEANCATSGCAWRSTTSALGHSSLHSLRELPVDMLKIHRELRPRGWASPGRGARARRRGGRSRPRARAHRRRRGRRDRQSARPCARRGLRRRPGVPVQPAGARVGRRRPARQPLNRVDGPPATALSRRRRRGAGTRGTPRSARPRRSIAHTHTARMIGSQSTGVRSRPCHALNWVESRYGCSPCRPGSTPSSWKISDTISVPTTAAALLWVTADSSRPIATIAASGIR